MFINYNCMLFLSKTEKNCFVTVLVTAGIELIFLPVAAAFCV